MLRYTNVAAVQIILFLVLFLDYKYCLSNSSEKVESRIDNKNNQELTTPTPKSLDRNFKILKVVKKNRNIFKRKLPKIYKKIIYKSHFPKTPKLRPVRCVPIDLLRNIYRNNNDFDDYEYEYDEPYLLYNRRSLNRKKRDYHEQFLRLSNLFRHIAKASEYEPPTHFEDHEILSVPPRIHGLAGPFIGKNITPTKYEKHPRVIPVTETIENDFIPQFKFNRNQTYFGVSNTGITTPGIDFFKPIKEVNSNKSNRYVIAYGKDYVNQMMRPNSTVARPVLPEVSGIYSHVWPPENHHIKRNFQPNIYESGLFKKIRDVMDVGKIRSMKII